MKFDPKTGERFKLGNATFELSRCTHCGITNMDGDPALDIPYPIVIAREENGGEVMCDDCLKYLLDSAGEDKPYRDPTELP